ncbi:WXG100 family type VII secretion target [Nonomuraea sp. NPDC049486]|uniref:WXG100 family type VII secretion target n=1 Tax=Nonomuraea sp. NPDC049486 TaxID=3155773 RepID=UPI003430F727
MGGTKHEIHLIKPSCGSWAVETGGRSVEQVVTFIKGFNLTSITQAASSYEDAKTAVETAREAIKTQAIKLAEVWEGEASVEAQTALGILYVTMGELATKLGAMHTPVDNLASVVREHQAFMEDHSKGILNTWTNRGGTGATWDDSIPDIYSAYAGYYGGDGKVLNEAKTDFGSPDELAGLHLQTFTNDLVVVHQAIPDTVDKSLRDIKPPGMPQDDPTQVDYPTGLPTGNPSPYSNTGLGLNGGTDGTGNPGGPSFADYDPSTGLPNPNGVDPNGTNPNGYDPNGNYPPGTSVPGGTVPIGSTTGPDNGTQPSVDTAGLNRNPPGTDGTTSLADYNPTTSGYSPTGTTPTTATTPGYTTPTTSATPVTYGGTGIGTGGALGPGQGTSLGTRSGTGAGMPFLPMGGMGGGGGGGDSRDRESTTWLHEDDDVWGDDTGSVNSRIG